MLFYGVKQCLILSIGPMVSTRGCQKARSVKSSFFWRCFAVPLACVEAFEISSDFHLLTGCVPIVSKFSSYVRSETSWAPSHIRLLSPRIKGSIFLNRLKHSTRSWPNPHASIPQGRPSYRAISHGIFSRHWAIDRTLTRKAICDGPVRSWKVHRSFSLPT